jgi:hypothetical protein
MTHDTLPTALSALPRGRLARRLARIRGCFRHPQLDAALAQGADPWSSAELMARAAQIGSLPYRRKVKAGMIALVALAERPRSGPAYPVQQQAVLAERDTLLALAERLGEPEPVEVVVAAELSLLMTDPSSPVYTGGTDPRELAEVTSRCLDRVAGGT